MNTKEIKDLKKKIKITQRQRTIIIGTMLGDGHLETRNNGRTYRLKIEQSIKHKKYVEWLYGELKEMVLTAPKKKKKKRYGKITYNYLFSTLSVGGLRFFARQFYRNQRRIIPKLIKKWLTPLAMAVWFMDDGQIKSNKHRALLINTQCYKKSDLKRLQVALKEKYGINTSLKKEPTGYRMYMLSETIDVFVDLIKPYILPSMRYKIGINILRKE